MWRSSDGLAGGVAHGAQDARLDLELVEDLGLERTDDLAVRADDVAHDLRLVQRAAVGQRRVGVDQLDRRHVVVALADARPGTSRPGRSSRRAGPASTALVGTMPATSPGRSMPVGVAEAVLVAPSTRVDRCRACRRAGRRTCRSSARSRSRCRSAPQPRPFHSIELRVAEGQVRPSSRPGSTAVILRSASAAGAGHELVRRARGVVRLDGVVEQRLVLVLEELVVVRPG